MGKETQSSTNFSVIGNLTIDRIFTREGEMRRQGGSAYFIATALADLGNNVQLYTHADEMPKNLSEKIIRYGNNSPTVIVTIDEEKTTASVNYPGSKIRLSELPQQVLGADCTVLATTFGEVSLDDVRKLRRSQMNPVVADIQGFQRYLDPVTQIPGKEQIDIEAFAEFDIMKMNQEEVAIQFPGLSFDEAAEELQRLGVGVTIFTLGQRGTLLYTSEKYVIPAQTVDVKHTVGAGDTYFGSFLDSYMRHNSGEVSAKAATNYTAQFLKEGSL